MKLIPLTALFLIACGSSASPQPTPSTDATDVGSASEAIRQLGKNDADVVKSCDDLVQRCEGFAGDAGIGGDVCDRIGQHCTELADQLSQARADFQACLEKVAACEAAATNPADCRDERQACNPAGKDFEARRGATLTCSEHAQSCMPRMRAMRGDRDDADDDGDAGANSCGADATDFVGCCHGHAGQGGPGGGFGGRDAGAPPPFGPPRVGPRPPRIGDEPRADDNDDADAGGFDRGNAGRGRAND